MAAVSPRPDETRSRFWRLIFPALATLVVLLGVILFTWALFKPRPEDPILVGVAAPVASTPAPIEAKPAPPVAPAPQLAKPEPDTSRPPKLTPRQRFLAVLRRAPGQITLMVEDDPQAQAYGRELKGLFEQAGWTVDVSQAFGSGPPERGFAAALGSTSQDAAVRDAFAAAGLPLMGPPPSSGLIQTPELFVGPPLEPKPAPLQPPSG